MQPNIAIATIGRPMPKPRPRPRAKSLSPSVVRYLVERYAANVLEIIANNVTRKMMAEDNDFMMIDKLSDWLMCWSIN